MKPALRSEAKRTVGTKTTFPSAPAISLETLLEAERVHLLQIIGILKCLYGVLLYADDDDATTHADVAHVCANLIDDCVDRLATIVRRYKAGEFRRVSQRSTAEVAAGLSPASPGRSREIEEGE